MTTAVESDPAKTFSNESDDIVLETGDQLANTERKLLR